MSRVFKETVDGAAKYDFVSRALDQFSDEIASASSIFIKPNLVSKEAYPTTTDPQLLDTVLQYLPDHAITVGADHAFDAPLNAFFDRKTRGVTKHHPLKRVCDDHGVDCVNLNKGPFAKRLSDRGLSVSLSTVSGSFDLKISLPVLKTHPICTLTGAVKNQFGLVRPTERVRLHASGLESAQKHRRSGGARTVRYLHSRCSRNTRRCSRAALRRQESASRLRACRNGSRSNRLRGS